MTQKEANELNEKIIHALEIAEYETLKKKAMLNQNVVVEDENGDPIEDEEELVDDSNFADVDDEN